MAVYLYGCTKCGHEQEAEHKMGPAIDVTCGECGLVHHNRLIPMTSFKLRGVGWAKDGYSVTDMGDNRRANEAKKGEKIT